MDVIEFIKKNSNLYGKFIAVEEKDRNYSYKDFWNLINNFASKLLKIKSNPPTIS